MIKRAGEKPLSATDNSSNDGHSEDENLAALEAPFAAEIARQRKPDDSATPEKPEGKLPGPAEAKPKQGSDPE